MRTLLASIIVAANIVICAFALVPSAQPDITVAPCTMHTLPAYTDTEHCIDASGTVIPR